MCGIVGVCGPLASPLADVVDEAARLMSHRGPDSNGSGRYNGAALAIRRLAIIDLETGDQPISNPAGNIHTVTNGQIYNYVELRSSQQQRGQRHRTNSDIEPIVFAYEHDGDDFVHQLRGMFATAIYDERRQRLILARDHFGQKPLYYAPLPQGVAFASELKALLPILAASGRSPSIDEQAIGHYLGLGFVPQPSTVYRGVHSVRPGEIVTWSNESGLEHRTYWDPAERGKQNREPGDYGQLRDVIAESVRLSLRSDVPVGAFLSGGLDSSIVVYEAARAGARDLRTFTVASEDQTFDESPVAQRTAHALGVSNELIPVSFDAVKDLHDVVRHFDQPFADSSAIATWAVSRVASRHRKVILTGDGGDELFGGYRRHLAAYLAGSIPPAARRPTGYLTRGITRLGASLVHRRSALGFAHRFADGLSRKDTGRYLRWTQDMLTASDRKYLRLAAPQTTEQLIAPMLDHDDSPLDQQLSLDRSLTLPSGLLVKMDMAASAWSLETRAPLLDHELASLAMRLEHSSLLAGRKTKGVLREAYRGLLPAEVLDGAKRGFELPISSWISGEWSPIIHDTVLSNNGKVRELVRAEFLEELFSERTDHRRNSTYLRYAVLVLELWLQGKPSSSRCDHDQSDRTLPAPHRAGQD